jgi:hypothetical protein
VVIDRFVVAPAPRPLRHGERMARSLLAPTHRDHAGNRCWNLISVKRGSRRHFGNQGRMETDDSFESAVQHHDALVAALGLPIWVGSEPTFTDREAQTPAWLHDALGDDKELRARALLGTLSRLMPGALVLRSTGRLYPGEKLPRWNLGLLRRRDGEPLWDGPPDPLLAAEPVPTGSPDIAAFASALAEAFASERWASECVKGAKGRRRRQGRRRRRTGLDGDRHLGSRHRTAAVCPARLRGQG